MISALKSFLQRRVYIDVSPTELVLDVGSGDKPHWRADILLDAFPSEAFASQRIGGGAAIIDRWFVQGNVEKMPFRDHAFDYVICSHLLEHVQHPDRALQELVRVSKRGYIEVPFEGSQKLNDFPSHLWYIHEDHGSLIFSAKQQQVFDPYIDQLMHVMMRSNLWSKFTMDHFDSCTVQKKWNGQIPFEIQGQASPSLMKDIELLTETSHQANTGSSVPGRLRSFFFSCLRKGSQILHPRKNISLEALLLCLNCSGTSFTKQDKGFVCNTCGTPIVCSTQPYKF